MDRTYNLSAAGLGQHDLRNLDWGIRMASSESGAKWRLSHSEQDADVVAMPADGDFQATRWQVEDSGWPPARKIQSRRCWLKSPIAPSAVVKLLDQLATNRKCEEGAKKVRQKIFRTEQRVYSAVAASASLAFESITVNRILPSFKSVTEDRLRRRSVSGQIIRRRRLQ